MFCCCTTSKLFTNAMDLYAHPISPPSRAVIMVAKELKLNLNVKFVDIMKGETRKDEFKKINFMHTIPTLVDGDITIWESRAIMTYLVNQYSPGSSLYPMDPKKRALVDMLLYIDVSNIYRSIFDFAAPQLLHGKKPEPSVDEKLKESLNNLEIFLDNGDNNFLTGGNITLADLSVYAGVTFLETVDYDLTPFPNTSTWLVKMKQRMPYDDEVTRKPHDDIRALISK